MPIQSTQVVISEKNQLSALYNNNKLKELHVSHTSYRIGNVYLGKIESIRININAAFIKLHPIEKNGFIPISNLKLEKSKFNTSGILENLEPNANVIVQIVKEPTGSKGPSLTTNIGISGEYVILLPFGEGITISKAIVDIKEKTYLKSLFLLLKPIGFGLLVKKEAQKIKEEDLILDLRSVEKKWSRIKKKIKKVRTPSLLNDNRSFINKTIRELYDNTIRKYSVDSYLGARKIYASLTQTKYKSPNVKILIEYYSDNLSIINNFYLDLSIQSILEPRINLITGGYIIIEKTEALTAIDINSGSFNKLTNSRATLLWINCEAASEIARQLKIRNIGGIVVIDFIDMSYQKDQMTLLNHFNSVLKTDTGTPKIIQLSEIGLVELTRKRQGQSIYDIFGHRCSRCNGLGHSIRLSNSVKNINSILTLETSPVYSKRLI